MTQLTLRVTRGITPKSFSNDWKKTAAGFPIIGTFFILTLVAAFPTRANTLAIFRTSLGEMAFELFDDDKPITVRNFIRLTESGAYHNSFIHRLVPGFIAQGGAFLTPSTTSTNYFLLYAETPHFGTITNEFTPDPRFSNVFGTIAMARSTNEHSARASWFINLGDNAANLDYQNGGFTVFARIVHGEEVLHALNTKSNFYGIIPYSPTFPTLPVRYEGAILPRYNDLIYSRIEILSLATFVQPDGSRWLTWNSPTGLLCRIEYQDPATSEEWQELYRTNGTGQVQTAWDDDQDVPHRTYRIQIE